MNEAKEEIRLRRISPSEQWDWFIPEMGIFALLRNLRNFDKDGISEESFRYVRDKLESPEVIAHSRLLPFRFLTAYLNVPSIRWGGPLERALTLSLPNVPVLPGKTLILIDMSASMHDNPLSVRPGRSLQKGEKPPVHPSRMQAGALFAFALALKNANRVSVHGFAGANYGKDIQFRIDGITASASILRMMETLVRQTGKVGHGTEIARAMRETYAGHDRVAIFTDEQETYSGPVIVRSLWSGQVYEGHGDVNGAVPASVPVYCWNLAGYEFSCMPVKGANRHALAGLTDSSFRLMQQIESGLQARWPWEQGDRTAGK